MATMGVDDSSLQVDSQLTWSEGRPLAFSIHEMKCAVYCNRYAMSRVPNTGMGIVVVVVIIAIIIYHMETM